MRGASRSGVEREGFVPVTTTSIVNSIYATMLRALLEGRDYRDVLVPFMPFILSELDALIQDYPTVLREMRSFAEVYWAVLFKDVPMPSFGSVSSGTEMFTMIKETLRRYRDRVIRTTSMVSESEIESEIEYQAARFMDVVARKAFRLLGVLT